MVKTRNELQTCLNLVRKPVAQPSVEASRKASLNNSEDPQNGLLSGPATRPKTPLAVENSVGKLAAPLRRGAQCQHGKESMANSHPPFGPCSTARLGRDFLFVPKKGLLYILLCSRYADRIQDLIHWES